MIQFEVERIEKQEKIMIHLNLIGQRRSLNSVPSKHEAGMVLGANKNVKNKSVSDT
jgi:hypothetical protein